MTEPIRFYLDQNVHGGTAPGLRARGIDAVSARDLSRCGLPDPDQLAFAASQGWVLVTFDQDYFTLHAAGTSHAGIAWCHPTKYSVGQLIHALELLHVVYTADEMVGRLEYL